MMTDAMTRMHVQLTVTVEYDEDEAEGVQRSQKGANQTG